MKSCLHSAVVSQSKDTSLSLLGGLDRHCYIKHLWAKNCKFSSGRIGSPPSTHTHTHTYTHTHTHIYTHTQSFLLFFFNEITEIPEWSSYISFQTWSLPTFRKCCSSPVMSYSTKYTHCAYWGQHRPALFFLSVYLVTNCAWGFNFNTVSFFKPPLWQAQEQSVHWNTLPILTEQTWPFLTLKRQPPFKWNVFLQQEIYSELKLCNIKQ